MTVRAFRSVGLAILILSIGQALVHGEDHSFREHVAPILTRHCLRCHEGNHAKGGLDLSTAKGLNAGAEGNPVVAPGKPDDSRLIEVVSGITPEMPKNGKPLSPNEVHILREWIAAGANWPTDVILKNNPLDWWSLRPLARPIVSHADRRVPLERAG
jgi:cytochrome c